MEILQQLYLLWTLPRTRGNQLKTSEQLAEMSLFQRNLRSNIRNGYFLENKETLEKAKIQFKDQFSKDCIQELIDELDPQ
jgi:hypothetical protein